MSGPVAEAPSRVWYWPLLFCVSVQDSGGAGQRDGRAGIEAAADRAQPEGKAFRQDHAFPGRRELRARDRRDDIFAAETSEFRQCALLCEAADLVDKSGFGFRIESFPTGSIPGHGQSNGPGVPGPVSPDKSRRIGLGNVCAEQRRKLFGDRQRRGFRAQDCCRPDGDRG